MRAYVIRRVLLVIPTLFLVSALVFLSVRFIPGDIIDVMSARMEYVGSGDINRELLRERLGIDRPVYVQYARWVSDILLHGTLGESLYGGFRVEERLAGRLGITVELGLVAVIAGLLIALPVGIYSAIRQYTAADYVGRSFAILGLATPNFWIGLMVMIYPAIWWGWTPPMTHVRFTAEPWENLRMFIIPSLILGTYLAASTMRMTRT
ncbi:MAG: ABC transporter permease, partial [Spirochaetaceae bacterium]|nr:ABC transporter permease [Spirochaetaceae bacterium]